jgi:hypothetical protein
MFTVSSALVAMGFIAQTPGRVHAVRRNGASSSVRVGLVHVRATGGHDGREQPVLRAITPIRGYYRTLSPNAPRYFAAWDDGDDEAAEALAMLGTRPSWATVLFTTASMVATINSIVGGVGVALLVWKASGSNSQALSITLGAVCAAALMVVAYVYQVRRYSRAAAADRLRFAAPSG